MNFEESFLSGEPVWSLSIKIPFHSALVPKCFCTHLESLETTFQLVSILSGKFRIFLLQTYSSFIIMWILNDFSFKLSSHSAFLICFSLLSFLFFQFPLFSNSSFILWRFVSKITFLLWCIFTLLRFSWIAIHATTFKLCRLCHLS